MVIPDTDEPWKRASVPFATSVSSWSAVMLAATTALRRTRLPAPIGAVVLGGGVMAIDSLLAVSARSATRPRLGAEEVAESAD